MRRGLHLLRAAAFCVGLILPACTSTPPPVPPAFFVPSPVDAVAVQTLIREQEHRLQTCAAERACPRAHYLRGLAALYQGRAIARSHFQAVLAAEPNGPYALSSRNWLLLLEEGRFGSVRETRLVRALELAVRQVLDDEAAIREANRALREAKSSSPAPKESRTVQALKRQLKERELEIDVLTEQIDALKRVDQEVRDQVKPSRPAK